MLVCQVFAPQPDLVLEALVQRDNKIMTALQFHSFMPFIATNSIAVRCSTVANEYSGIAKSYWQE
jgi:hypothetical protein